MGTAAGIGLELGLLVEQPTFRQSFELMRVAQEKFGTEFFKTSSCYVRKKHSSPSGIASILSVNPMDARAYYDALAQ